MKLKCLKIRKRELSNIVLIYGTNLVVSTKYPIYNRNMWFCFGEHSWIEHNGVVYTHINLAARFKSHMELINHIPLSYNEVYHIHNLLGACDRKEMTDIIELYKLDCRQKLALNKSIARVQNILLENK